MATEINFAITYQASIFSVILNHLEHFMSNHLSNNSSIENQLSNLEQRTAQLLKRRSNRATVNALQQMQAITSVGRNALQARILQFDYQLDAIAQHDEQRLINIEMQQNLLEHRLESSRQQIAELSQQSAMLILKRKALQQRHSELSLEYTQMQTEQGIISLAFTVEQRMYDELLMGAGELTQHNIVLQNSSQQQQQQLDQIDGQIAVEELIITSREQQVLSLAQTTTELGEHYQELAQKLSDQLQQINDISDMLQQMAKQLEQCHRGLVKLQREQAQIMQVIGVVVAVGAMAMTGGFSGFFSTGTLAAGSSAATATASWSSAVMQWLMKEGTWMVLKETIGKICPLAAQALTCIGSAYSAGATGSAQELLKFASKEFFIGQMGELATLVGGEPLGRVTKIVLSHGDAEFKELGKEILIDQVAFNAGKALHNSKAAAFVDTLVKGAAKMLSSSETESKQIVKDTVFQMAGQAASAGIKDPALSHLLQGMVTTGLRHYDAQKEVERQIMRRLGANHTGISFGDEIDEGDEKKSEPNKEAKDETVKSTEVSVPPSGKSEEQKKQPNNDLPVINKGREDPTVKSADNNEVIPEYKVISEFKGGAKLIAVGKKVTPGKIYLYMHGMNNTEQEVIERVKNYSKAMGDTQIYALVRLDEGILVDGAKVIGLKLGLPSADVDAAVSVIREGIKKVGDKGEYTIIGHSAGVQVMYNALKKLSEQERSRLVVAGIGGATLIPENFYKRGTNYVSKNDAISAIQDPLGLINAMEDCDPITATRHALNKKPNVVILDSKAMNDSDRSWPFRDHLAEGKTYGPLTEELNSSYCSRVNPESGLYLAETFLNIPRTLAENKALLEKLQKLSEEKPNNMFIKEGIGQVTRQIQQQQQN